MDKINAHLPRYDFITSACQGYYELNLKDEGDRAILLLLLQVEADLKHRSGPC